MVSANSQDAALSIDEIKKLTPSELLAAMRKGTEQSLFIKFGKGKLPVRLLTAMEEADVLNKARLRAIEKAGPEADSSTINGYRSRFVMHSILHRATSIKGDVGFTQDELNEMSSDELTYLYDQYVLVCKVVDADFNQLSPEEIKNIVFSVKKKKTQSNDYFSWQLAAVGKFFLEEIVPVLPEDNELGS